MSGKCQSCGCLKSKGNQKIKSLLQSNNYIFIPEYPVRINDKTYYFDFALFDKNNKILCFIEYDGILHFEQDSYHGWNTEENWEKTKINDNIKNNYGKENNIEIIRIPYLDYDKITIDYIQEKLKCIKHM